MVIFKQLGKAAAYCLILILAIVAPESTRQAYGDVGVVLNGAKDRETIQEFEDDWQLLIRARARAIHTEQIQTASEGASFR